MDQADFLWLPPPPIMFYVLLKGFKGLQLDCHLHDSKFSGGILCSLEESCLIKVISICLPIGWVSRGMKYCGKVICKHKNQKSVSACRGGDEHVINLNEADFGSKQHLTLEHRNTTLDLWLAPLLFGFMYLHYLSELLEEGKTILANNSVQY